MHAVKSRMNTGPLTVSPEHSQKHFGSRPTQHAVNDFTYTARTQDRRFGRGAKTFEQVYRRGTELGIQSGRAYTRHFFRWLFKSPDAHPHRQFTKCLKIYTDR